MSLNRVTSHYSLHFLHIYPGEPGWSCWFVFIIMDRMAGWIPLCLSSSQRDFLHYHLADHFLKFHEENGLPGKG
jgi:hypothetical protein